MVLSWEACSRGFPLFEPVSFLRVLINTCVFLNLLCIINCSIQKINTIVFPFFKPTALYIQAAGLMLPSASRVFLRLKKRAAEAFPFSLEIRFEWSLPSCARAGRCKAPLHQAQWKSAARANENQCT